MTDTALLLLGIAFCLTTIAVLSLSKSQRDVLFSRFRIRPRRTSSATTPPRSLSPEKKVPNNAPLPKSDDYKDAFPPSRREALANIAETLPAARRKKLIGHEIDQELFEKSLIPFTANYAEADGDKYTPTGFSVDEIKVLGDFPDYAELSGVPLPEPYKNFDIDRALPRPYRPFRWAYHQTMCKSS